MPSYLVTGGAGFIGSSLVERLVARGAQVRVLDNFLTGKREWLEPFGDKIDLVEGDLRNAGDCWRAVDGVDVVFHEAALPSVPRSIEDPGLSMEINTMGTLRLLEACRRAKVRRIIYAGSSSVYGLHERPVNTERDLPAPVSPYAVSKLAGEHLCMTYHHLYNLEAVVLRYFNVFGPRQDPTSQYAAVVPIFITSVLAGRQPPVFGDGRQTRDFTYVENIVEANLLASEHPRAAGQVFNIACGSSHSLLEMLDLLAELHGAKVEPRFEPPRPGDIRHSRASIEKARNLIGYKPVVGLREGLKRTIEWYNAR